MMESKIENIELRFKCDMSWDKMTDLNGSKYCDKCQKKVYDFTQSNLNEFEKILIENNYRVCARYSEEQMAPAIQKHKTVWHKWLSAAIVLLGFHFYTEKVSAQTPPKQIITPDKPIVKYSIGDTVQYKASPYKVRANAKVDSLLKFMEQFSDTGYPGGEKAFKNYIKAGIHLPGNWSFTDEHPDSTLMVKFYIKPDGTVYNVSIIQGFSRDIDSEVVNRINASSKWQPPIRDIYAETVSIGLKYKMAK